MSEKVIPLVQAGGQAPCAVKVASFGQPSGVVGARCYQQAGVVNGQTLNDGACFGKVQGANLREPDALRVNFLVLSSRGSIQEAPGSERIVRLRAGISRVQKVFRVVGSVERVF